MQSCSKNKQKIDSVSSEISAVHYKIQDDFFIDEKSISSRNFKKLCQKTNTFTKVYLHGLTRYILFTDILLKPIHRKRYD
jgi:hypothetical protein